MPATTFDRGARALPLPSAATINLRLPRWLPGLGLTILAIGLLMLALQWRQPMLSRLQIEGHFDRVTPESVRQVDRSASGERLLHASTSKRSATTSPRCPGFRVHASSASGRPACACASGSARRTRAGMRIRCSIPTRFRIHAGRRRSAGNPPSRNCRGSPARPGNEKLVDRHVSHVMSQALAGNPAGIERSATGRAR
jgi:hypothetical protein